MPIDEFGREIPAAGGAASSGNQPPPFADPLRRGDQPGPGRPGPGGNPLLDGELSSRRDDGRSRSPGGKGGGERRSSPSPEGGRRREYDDRRGGLGRRRGRSRADSGYDDRGGGGGGGGRRGGRGDGGRRHRSRSYGNNDDHHHGSGRHHGGGRGGGGRSSHRGSSASGGGQGSRAHKAHASERYAEQPMLCQFLWKKEMEDDQAKLNKSEGGEEKKEGGGDDDAIMEEKDETENSEANPQEEENKPQPPPLFESTEAESEAYTDYNTKYCLNYVRTFFNHHLDDPWFRTRLSPLEKYRQAKKERSRSNAEANEFKNEIVQSLDDMKSGVIPKKDPDCAEYLGPPKCNFVASCRLGVGTKPTSAAHHHHHHHHMHQHHYDQQQDQKNEKDMQHNILQGEDRNRIERHAKSHLHSFIRTESCVKIMDVPSNVSDAQLLSTLSEHCGKEPSPKEVYSNSVCVPFHDNASMDPYHRTSYAVFPTSAAKDHMLESLHKANEEANRHRSRNDRHRKGDALPRVLDMDVDCTDVYGRGEVDADGKGGAPPSLGKKKKEADTAPKLPAKRCSVYVSTLPLSSSQPVSVLSAGLSSRKRVMQDKEDVSTISGILDEVREIEAGSRLNDLLRLLYPGDELYLVDDEDLLDISIAYLRRVHLFSFYHGCTAAEDVGNVLSFSHPAGTIHLRLRDADEILAKMAAEERGHDVVAMAEDVADGEGAEKEDGAGGAPETAKDMLVTRLNDSIAKALEKARGLAERGPSCLLDAETDTAARNVESAEKTARQVWIENHGIVDEDGRARCAFHFCRKLFKDRAFLHKHLLKKHSDQLRSECAKCHDGPMMASWDSDNRRPVPPVLIDCGSKFGLVPSPVTGNAIPNAHDPEPELWREEQERMAEEERIRREREAAARAAEEEMIRRREVANAGEKRKSNFVDPDDMVEEKVELKFDVEVVAPPPKKKKKKKKSLL